MKSLTIILAIWGAVLSTILALIKVWELYQNRFRVKVEFSSWYQEHSVMIANLSPKPIIITYFELFWEDANKGTLEIDTGTYEGCNITIQSNDSKKLTFDEQYCFPIKAGCKLYIRLHVVGRKPITKQLA